MLYRVAALAIAALAAPTAAFQLAAPAPAAAARTGCATMKLYESVTVTSDTVKLTPQQQKAFGVGPTAKLKDRASAPAASAGSASTLATDWWKGPSSLFGK